MFTANKYRDHNTAMLSEADIGKSVRVSGWVENIRDHGGIEFIDLRDHYGMLQVTFQNNEKLLDGITKECAVSISGKMIKRDESTYNPKIATGTIELAAESVDILGKVTTQLPFEIPESHNSNEDIRLRYRFLDMRNRRVHENIVFRSQVMSFMREKMTELGFLELQTPILSTSSPEGARDYLIPSRKHHGRFYALPQAPQIFKQLYMVSGFDKYFQLAPCFRDEDARADRTPGEFYQLDLEMSFATQEDVFAAAEQVFPAILEKFGNKKYTHAPFPRITFEEAMLKYGSDKPDLRNPLFIIDVSDLFVDSSFKPFSNKTVRAIRVPKMAEKSKSFFEKMEEYALSIGMKGLGYFKVEEGLKFNGPIDKFLREGDREELAKRAELEVGDVLYFIADNKKNAEKFAGLIRSEVADRMGLIDNDRFEICWIVDFPMYEEDEETGKPIFTHNPFSMPQGELEALNTKDPCDVLAYQYDVVCNGVELASGAVRNHDIDVMVKAFEIAGYTEEDVKEKFGALYSAFKFGAPPHAGMAFGIDRMIMLLLDEESIREVIAFPLNSNAQDLLLGAPTEVTEQQLREVHIKVRQRPQDLKKENPAQ
ncbi:MAG: aspartate--tRNA ligase [Ruminiclostridium sp.]|nr:aspartate--tRNA ligase [Ruminiclostridium sp.]